MWEPRARWDGGNGNGYWSPGHRRVLSAGMGGTKPFLLPVGEPRAAPARLGRCWQGHGCWTWTP